MKILVVMGSPRRKGNTYQVAKKVEENMKQLGGVEFEYLFLKDMDLKSCLGCGACFTKGEEICPLKDDRVMIEERMQKADGVIFTSPNYVFNVTGLMKNFIDRFGYVCHRPRFFKNAMILTTSGIGAGTRLMKMSFQIAPRAWGFKLVKNFDIVTEGDPELQLENFSKKDDKKVKKATEKFYPAILNGRPKPSIFSMALFLFSREEVKKLKSENFDSRYYRDHGWLEDDVYYFHDPETNFLRKGLARILSKFMGLMM